MLHFTIILAACLPLYLALTDIPLQDCSRVKLTEWTGDIITPLVKPAVFCKQWFIQATPGVVITVSYINLGRLNCTGAYLEIGSKRRERLCKTSTPHAFISDDNNLWITYYQNTSLVDVGFKAKYTIGYETLFVDCLEYQYTCSNGKCIYDSWRCNGADECGDMSDEYNCSHVSPSCSRHIDVKSYGYIISPKYTDSNKKGCTWHIHSTQNLPIQLRFQYFRYQIKDDTAYVSVYDGESTKSRLIGKYKSLNIPPKMLQSTSNDLTVVFHTDASVRGLEFQFSYQNKGMCLPAQERCVGEDNCYDKTSRCDSIWDCPIAGQDEKNCFSSSCSRYIDIKNFGFVALPSYPYARKDCTWYMHSKDNLKIQLKFKYFRFTRKDDSSYIVVYDGDGIVKSRLIGRYDSRNKPPKFLESTSDYLTVVFHTEASISGLQLNFTYQNKGMCLPDQYRCVGENDCYDKTRRCDGIWNCPVIGQDEKNCGNCLNDLYTCGQHNAQCYNIKQRCNGIGHCTNNMDELSCTSTQCGPHNGTFLCDNFKCVYETWKCDKSNDCGDNSDERDCGHITNLIKIAAVSGALICGLLLVVALGCTCKLYSIRINGHRHRHETPLSRLYAEYIRRRAPPPYHEAMITSRSYDEVRRDYIEQSRQTGGRPPSRRGRRSRNGSQSQDNQENNEMQYQHISNNVEVAPIERQLSVSTDVESQTSTTMLIPPNSNECESDTEHQNETGETTSYTQDRQGNKSDSDSDCVTPVHPEPDRNSVDICSMDATIASCDSWDENTDFNDKSIDIVVDSIPRVRQNSEESLNSLDLEETSFGEFTIADL